jgi:hypothetical protein
LRGGINADATLGQVSPKTIGVQWGLLAGLQSLWPFNRGIRQLALPRYHHLLTRYSTRKGARAYSCEKPTDRNRWRKVTHAHTNIQKLIAIENSNLADLSFPKIISGRIDGAVQPGSECWQCRQSAGSLDA